MHRRIVAALAAVVLLGLAFTLPGVAQTKTTLVFSAGPTGGSGVTFRPAPEETFVSYSQKIFVDQGGATCLSSKNGRFSGPFHLTEES